MVTNLIPVVGTLLVGLLGTSPPIPRRVTASFDPRPIGYVAAVDSFSLPAPKPKKRKPPAAAPAPHAAPSGAAGKASPRQEDDGDQAPRRTKATSAARHRPAESDEAESESESGSENGTAGDQENEEDQPKAKRKPPRGRASSDDEEEEDDDENAPLVAFPVVLPRLISFVAGGSLMGRNFAFNVPLQKEATFPRPGLLLALETYPLVGTDFGWMRQLGLQANLEMEFGSAALQQPGGGPTVSFPTSQRRYAFDVRYAFIPGERVVVIPALGLGNNTFDLKTNMPTAPSMCTGASTLPCIAGVQATYLVADLHVRVAVNERFSLTLSGGYLLGLAVGRGNGQIGQERTPKMTGFHVELGANWMLMDWLAVRVAAPIISHAFTFSGGTAAYTAATETYFGGTVSAVLFTR